MRIMVCMEIPLGEGSYHIETSQLRWFTNQSAGWFLFFFFFKQTLIIFLKCKYHSIIAILSLLYLILLFSIYYFVRLLLHFFWFYLQFIGIHILFRWVLHLDSTDAVGSIHVFSRLSHYFWHRKRKWKREIYFRCSSSWKGLLI